jgi:bacillithiol biosynthesis deacetylase BshB1
MEKVYDHYIMAVGPHPDDIEIGCGGVLYRSAQEGKQNIIIDVCPSQLSSRGTTVTRIQEAEKARTILWANKRDNLLLCDGNLCDSYDHRLIVAKKIRQYRPEIVLLPWSFDRHPDHEGTAQMVKNGVFYAGLPKVDCDGLAPHKPRLLLHYMIWYETEPDLIIPLTPAEFDKKMEAFLSYESQYDTNSRWLEYIKARHIKRWAAIGQPYGEGFSLYSHKVWVSSLDHVMSWFF